MQYRLIVNLDYENNARLNYFHVDYVILLYGGVPFFVQVNWFGLGSTKSNSEIVVGWRFNEAVFFQGHDAHSSI